MKDKQRYKCGLQLLWRCRKSSFSKKFLARMRREMFEYSVKLLILKRNGMLGVFGWQNPE